MKSGEHILRKGREEVLLYLNNIEEHRNGKGEGGGGGTTAEFLSLSREQRAPVKIAWYFLVRVGGFRALTRL